VLLRNELRIILRNELRIIKTLAISWSAFQAHQEYTDFKVVFIP